MTNIFHLSIYGLTTLAALMLTIAEEFPFPTIISVFLAPTAYVLNERRRTVRLSVKTANRLGGIAIALAATEFFIVPLFVMAGEEAERRVLAGAHLLGYLSWISLFQDKQPRNYWWLTALGLIQVAVGAILTNSGFYGVLFFIYFFWGLWTLSIFSVFQVEQSFANAGASPQRLLPTENTSGQGLIAQLVHHQADDFRNAIQLDADQKWVNRRFVLGVIGVSVSAGILGAAFFVLTPRIWAGQTYQSIDNDDLPIQTATGFTAEVSLGNIGQILESNAKAFEVRFYDGQRNTELDVVQIALESGYEEPTFRGSVMGIYDNGRWNAVPGSDKLKELLSPTDRHGDVKQSYVLADPRGTTLFCMQPTFGAESSGDGSQILTDLATAMLVRQGGLGTKSNYEVFLVRPTRPPRPMPRVRHDSSDEARKLQRELLPLLREPPKNMPQLTELARKLRSQLPPDAEDIDIARKFESHLRESGEYAYSLKAEVKDPKIDPVEDFLFNRREGHCEYFASALALMLRSQGIPSRLVHGYKGGEKNKYSGAWVVEQRHAHAWVEARVQDMWGTFDPTPASRNELVREIGVQRSLLSSLQETLAGIWSQNVVRMSIDSQNESIYRPMGRWIVDQIKEFTKLLGGRGETITEFLTNPRKWFSTEVFIVVFVVLGLITAVRAIWRRFRPADFTWRGWLKSLKMALYERWLDRQGGRRIAFHDRFIKILRQHGRVRTRAQTPLEFARSIEAHFRERLEAQGLITFPTELVSLFYEVRYGNSVAAPSDLNRMESRLGQFEAALAAR